MIEISVDTEQNLVVFKNSGQGTKGTVDAAFRTVKRQFDTFGPVKLLIDWTEYDGVGGSAADIARRILDVADMVFRVAFVVDPRWKSEATHWMKLFDKTPVRLFEGRQAKDAHRWLIS